MNLSALKAKETPRRYQPPLNNFGCRALLQAVRFAKPQNHPRCAGAEHFGPISSNCWATEYERRMRRFNLAVVLAALVSLAFLITYSVIGWSNFLS
jgi:hypothetical protein